VSIEQAAKVLLNELPLSPGIKAHYSPIIAKHLEAFAGEQNITNEALSKQRETLVLKLEAENRELLKDKERLDLLDRINGSLLLCFMGGAKFVELNLTGKESLRSAMVRDVLEIAKRQL